ncbi:hypothetical protein RKE25_03580 [Dyella sp. BiH032]|uniref:hypothetical protein n=1 Tax=Dyella sp. BiH032 TaxID=3075430 RepID=UPI0028935B4E|nr:hypothetical protein [Dyella sp. BiH032]WNL46731.1 hypothetical protein RKE25_03580 [Dyella sp. BiH032]
MRRTFIASILVCLLLPLAAQAQQNDRFARGADELKQRFVKADTDGDGALNREEAKAMPRVSSHFDDIDADHDGRVTLQEIGRFAAAMRGSR